MKFFQRDHRSKGPEHRKIYARFELAYTFADFMAAVLFIVGSIMFFSEAWTTFGTWLFLFGSILFATKPTLRLCREIYLYRMGDFDDLADEVAPHEPKQ